MLPSTAAESGDEPTMVGASDPKPLAAAAAPAASDLAKASATPKLQDKVVKKKVEERAADAVGEDAPAALALAAAEDEELAEKLLLRGATRAERAKVAAEKAAADRLAAEAARKAEATLKRREARRAAKRAASSEAATAAEHVAAATAQEQRAQSQVRQEKLSALEAALASKASERGVDEDHQEQLDVETAAIRTEVEAARAAAKEAKAREEATATEETALREARAAAEEAEAAEEAAAKAAEAERKRQQAEFTLAIGGLRAFGVPCADENSGSDPYVEFELLELEEGAEERNRTEALQDAGEEPVWPGSLQITLPAGSPPALSKTPLLRVSLFDQDLTNDDDLLGVAELRVDASAAEEGRVERLSLEGQRRALLLGGGQFEDHFLSFSWRLLPFVPPAATLLLTAIEAKGLPISAVAKGKKAKKKDRLSDPYLRFSLLEVGDLLEEARVPAQPGVKDAKWDGVTLSVALPKGSPRPPLLSIRMWDDDLHEQDKALAKAEVRLSEAREGLVAAKLQGLKKVVKDVKVTFRFQIVEDGAGGEEEAGTGDSTDGDDDDEKIASGAPEAVVVDGG